MSELFSQTNPAQVVQKICALERFADKRDRFLDRLDFHSLDQQTRREIEMADSHIAEQILFGKLYAQHLCDMIALGQQLPAQAQCAA